MQLSDDDIIALGEFSESVLTTDAFTTIVRQYEMQAFINWKSTAPQNAKEREFAFAKLSGLQDFLHHMQSFVVQKNDLLREPSLDEDAPIDGID